MLNKITRTDIEALIRLAIKEDIGSGDITSLALFRTDEKSEAVILSKDNGIFCGGNVITQVYEAVDPSIRVEVTACDGMEIIESSEIARINGTAQGILSGERITLNFIQRMCGIATNTRSIVSLLDNTDIKILDTRKTLPGFRILDKYAVAVGGGTNHRMGLFDMIMIKDNHIKAAGSIQEAVRRVRNLYRNKFTVEVETSNLIEVGEAADSGVDIIMLDNMNHDMIRDSIRIIKKRAKIEVSGNISEERIVELKNLDIDFISMGSLTHSFKNFDLTMRFL